MTWIENEQSVESSEPREGIEIKHGAIAYRLATGSRNQTINGNVFPAAPGERGEVTVTVVADRGGNEITLPVAHTFVQRWLAGPPALATVVIYRKQPSGTETYWRGRVERVSVAGRRATLHCDSVFAANMKRKLPTVVVSRTCQHILYDGMCKVDRAAFRQVTTVASFDGNLVTVASVGVWTDQYAQYGEILHLSSGERMVIAGQVGTLLTLQRPIVELRDGDAVHVFAGCQHDILTCRDKFANVVNYGGMPNLPKRNAFIRGGMGVYQTKEEDE